MTARLSLLLFPSCQKIRSNQLIQIAIEHAIDIANLHARAQVLHHAIRLQDVGADLRAEVDLELGVFDLLASLRASSPARIRRGASAECSWRSRGSCAASARSGRHDDSGRECA